LREHQKAFEEKGAGLAAIGLGDRQYARFFREKTGIAFPLLIDEQRLAYRAAGLKSANLLHLLRRHKTGKNPFQLGGSFIFGPGNVDRFAHISETFGDNASVDALLAALA